MLYFKKEKLIIKELLNKYYLNSYFWAWILMFFYFFWKLKWLIILYFWFLSFSSLYILLIKKKIKIKNNKLSAYTNYNRINILSSLNYSGFDLNNFIAFCFLILFRLIIGMSFKIFKSSLFLFESFFEEFHYADLKKKKIKKKIIFKFINNSIIRFFHKEFRKSIMLADEGEIIIKNNFLKKKIKIITDIQW